MRLLQAVGLILTSYTSLIALAQPSHSAAQHLATRLTLVSLQDWLNVTRRSMRTFWFLRAFQGSYAQYAAGPQGLEDLLDVVAGSLLGVFGLLETVTIPDLLRIPGLAVFGAEQTQRLNVQAQMCWFAALLAMVLSAGVKILRLLAERAVPAEADFGGTEQVDEKSGGSSSQAALAKKRAVEKKRKQDKAEEAKKTQAKIAALTLKMVNDALDMVIPANICGWSSFHPGQVGMAMAATSLITLRGHWERCGRALQ